MPPSSFPKLQKALWESELVEGALKKSRKRRFNMQALKYKHSRRWDSHPVYLKNILSMLHFLHVVFNGGCFFRRQTCHPSFHHL